MSPAPIVVENLGLLRYDRALELMRDRVEVRAEGRIPDTLLVVRHEPVITVGRKRGARANVLAPSGIPVVEVERGGDVTFHGPGQIVVYPILALEGPERDLHRLLRTLEASVIATLAHFGVVAERSPGLTGVWCQGRKIASIGVAVKRWVSYHGVAFNVQPDAGFAAIRPCGLESTLMTSLQEILGSAVNPADVQAIWIGELARVLDREIVPAHERA